MLTVHKCSDTGLFRHLSNPAFFNLKLQKQITSELIFFSKYSKFCADFRNAEKNSENIFRFSDNCIWIRCVKQSLSLRENTFPRVSVCEQTVSRSQILLRQNFSSWFSFRVIKKNDKNTAMQIQAVIWSLQHVDCQWMFWHGSF